MKLSNAISNTGGQLLTIAIIIILFGSLYILMPVEVTIIGTMLSTLTLSYVLIQHRLSEKRHQMMVMIVWPVLMGSLLVWGGWRVWAGKLDLVSYLFVLPMALVFFQLLSIIPFAFYQNCTAMDKWSPSESLPSVSVLIPAYNEEAYISRTIESLLITAYPEDKLEIIVIDDGSTDNTYQKANRYSSDRVRVFSKENGGKYSALNYGLMLSDNDIIVTIDADSIIGPNAIKDIVAPLQADSKVGAVASNVQILNQNNLITKMQALEYSVGINLIRRMFDWFSGVPVVPGCLGAFRRSALEEVNNYDPDTLTEDYDLTVKVLRAGYEVRASSALVYTEAPDTWRSLYKQRIRWYRGNVETHLKHSTVFFKPKYDILHTITLPLRMIAMIIGPLTTGLVIFTIAVAIASGSIYPIVTIFTVFLMISVFSTLLALQFKGDDLSLIIYTVALSTLYKIFRDLITIQAVVDVLLRSNFSWTSPTRIRNRKE
jgi:poly-beta-1,6 N-acetyl-D-glucosamine synthase